MGNEVYSCGLDLAPMGNEIMSDQQFSLSEDVLPVRTFLPSERVREENRSIYRLGKRRAQAVKAEMRRSVA